MDGILITKIIHIVAVISWMAGLLYLPRLFVYHTENIEDSSCVKVFRIMEHRLYFMIMTPAAVVSWITGLILAYWEDFFLESWFLYKLLAVFLLTITHLYSFIFMKAFTMEKRVKSSKFFRIFNEVPTVLMIIIITFVILKPY